MKKLLSSMCLLMLSVVVMAQTFVVVDKEGNRKTYNVSNLDSITFQTDYPGFTVYEDVLEKKQYTFDEVGSFYIDSNWTQATLSFEGGGLTDQGLPYLCNYDRTKFYNYIRTPKYIKTSRISFISDISGYYRIYCYNKRFDFIGLSESTNNLINGTVYIKIVIFNKNGFRNLPTIEAKIDSNESIEFYNNNYAPVIYFSFEVELPLIDRENTSHAGNMRNYDNGCVILPPNYSNDGIPVPLVIFCHGSNGYHFKRSSTSFLYYDYLKFISDNGYAVVDCSGLSDKYAMGEYASPDISNSRHTPVSVACYLGLYDYMRRNYNISESVYIFGKSNGALAATYFGITQQIPVKAVGSLAGSLSIPMSMRYTSGKSVQYWTDRFNMKGHTFNVPDDKFLYQVETEEDRQFIASNVEKYQSYDPFLLMSDMNPDVLVGKLFSYCYNDLDKQEIWDIVNVTHKDLIPPMKIWHATDDTSVPIVLSRYFKKMVDNKNGICYLREFPSGCGGHHAVDNSSLAPHVQYKTKYAGVEDIPVAYAELVDFFNAIE